MNRHEPSDDFANRGADGGDSDRCAAGDGHVADSDFTDSDLTDSDLTDSDSDVDPRSRDPWAELDRERDGTALSESALRGEVIEHMLQPFVADERDVSDPELNGLDPREAELATGGEEDFAAEAPAAAGAAADGSLLARAEARITEEVLRAESERATDRVFEQLMTRAGEAQPRPRIEPVRRFAELAGAPHTQFPVIHVAGTNGKTSTSRAIESLLRAHGLHTGLFTSPHLVSFAERFQLDGVPVDGVELERAWLNLQPALTVVDRELTAAGHGPITFFEALAVLTCELFADAPVDVAVIEVGMGGEWDATNIVTGEVAVFTPVALDHTGILGSTIAEIARTKAGIIKPGCRVVSARQEPAAAAEIAAAASRCDAAVVTVGGEAVLRDDRVAVGGRLVSVTGPSGHAYRPSLLPLFGAHQAENLTLAVAAVEAFFGGRPIPDDVYEQGLGQLTSPGRLQLIAQDPPVYVDAAHNPHGARSLVAAVRESFDFAEVAVVVGVLADKDAAGVLAELAPLAARVLLCPVASPRGVDPEALATVPSHPGAVSVWESLADALDEAREWAGAEPARGVLVTGSVVLAGEAIAFAEAEGWMER